MELNIVYLRWGWFTYLGFPPWSAAAVNSFGLHQPRYIVLVAQQWCFPACVWLLPLSSNGHWSCWVGTRSPGLLGPGVCWSSSEKAVVSQLLRDRMWGTNHSNSPRSSQLPLVTVTLQRLQCVIWCSGDRLWGETVWTGNPSTCCSWPAELDTLWQTMCSFGYSSP